MSNNKQFLLPPNVKLADLCVEKTKAGTQLYDCQLLDDILIYNNLDPSVMTDSSKWAFILFLYNNNLEVGGKEDKIAESLVKDLIGLNKPSTISKNSSYAIEPSPEPHQVTALRQKTGMTQTEAAELLGLTGRQLIGDYERGVKSPSPQTWTLWLLLTGNHPKLKVVSKRILPFQKFKPK